MIREPSFEALAGMSILLRDAGAGEYRMNRSAYIMCRPIVYTWFCVLSSTCCTLDIHQAVSQYVNILYILFMFDLMLSSLSP